MAGYNNFYLKMISMLKHGNHLKKLLEQPFHVNALKLMIALNNIQRQVT